MKNFAYLQKTYPTFSVDDQSEIESIYKNIHEESKQPISKVRSKVTKQLFPEVIKWLFLASILPITYQIVTIFTTKPVLDAQFFSEAMTNIGIFTLVIWWWPTILGVMLTYYTEKDAVRNGDFLLHTETGSKLRIIEKFFTTRLWNLSRLEFSQVEREKLMKVWLLELVKGKEDVEINHLDGRGKEINSLIGTTGEFIVLEGDWYTVMTKRILDISYSGKNSTIYNQGVLTKISIPNTVFAPEEFIGVARNTKVKTLLLSCFSLIFPLFFFILGIFLSSVSLEKVIIFGILVSITSFFYFITKVLSIWKMYHLNESFPESIAKDLEELSKNFPWYLSFFVAKDTVYMYSDQKLENVFFKNITPRWEFIDEIRLYISLKEWKNFAEKIIKKT